MHCTVIIFNSYVHNPEDSSTRRRKIGLIMNWILSFIIALQKLKTQTKNWLSFFLTFVYFCNVCCCAVYVWLQIHMCLVHIGFVEVGSSASMVFWFSLTIKQSLYHMEEFSLYQVIRSWNAECEWHVNTHFFVILWSKNIILYYKVIWNSVTL